MATLSPLFFLLPLLLLSIYVAGDGDICSEGLGICGKDCDARCRARHGDQKPQGRCDFIGVSLCTCYYSCGDDPPVRKMCNLGLGFCSFSCGNECCNSKCLNKHEHGEGFCNTIDGISLCQCSYPC